MEDLKIVKELVQKILLEQGYELYSFTYLRQKNTLEIIIDREEPINLEDITNISVVISDLLDKHDFCEDSYTLDISSLGIEKPIAIEKLDKYVNNYVNLHLSHPYKGVNIIEGTLLEVTPEIVKISYKNKTRDVICELNKKDIDKARLAIKF